MRNVYLLAQKESTGMENNAFVKLILVDMDKFASHVLENLLIKNAYVHLVNSGISKIGNVFQNVIIGKFGMENNAFVKRVMVVINLENVNHVQKILLALEIDVIAQKDLHGMKIDGIVFTIAILDKFGMEDNVSVIMDLQDLVICVNLALKDQHNLMINVSVLEVLIGTKANGLAFLNADNGNNGKVINVFVKVVVEDIISIVNHVLSMQKLLIKNVYARLAIVGSMINGHVFLNALEINIGTVNLVYAKEI